MALYHHFNKLDPEIHTQSTPCQQTTPNKPEKHQTRRWTAERPHSLNGRNDTSDPCPKQYRRRNGRDPLGFRSEGFPAPFWGQVWHVITRRLQGRYSVCTLSMVNYSMPFWARHRLGQSTDLTTMRETAVSLIVNVYTLIYSVWSIL